MPPKKQWDEEESDSSNGSGAGAAAAAAAAAGRRKFEDEEDSDVVDDWDAAEDSEVEREKAKKAAAAKAAADAEAAASKKSKKERIEERRAERARQLASDDEDDSDEETEAARRERLKRTEIESDLNHAADLFGDIGVSKSRKGNTVGSAVPLDPKDPSKTVDLAALPLLNPQTKLQFESMRNVLVPILAANGKKAHYGLFLQEFCKQLAKDQPSDQIKKIASTLTALSNERLKEEKAQDKGGKKSKAQKTKTSLVASRPNTTDTATYEEDFGDDDFM